MMRRRWVRWLVWSVLGCIALIAVAFGVLAIRNPFRAELLALSIIYPLIANTSPPPIVKQVFATGEYWYDWEKTGQTLTTELQQRFPTGSREDELKSVLSRQGFKPPWRSSAGCIPQGQEPPPSGVSARCPTSDQGTSLVYRWGSVVCTNTIDVDWTADDRHQLTKLDATYHAACL